MHTRELWCEINTEALDRIAKGAGEAQVTRWEKEWNRGRRGVGRERELVHNGSRRCHRTKPEGCARSKRGGTHKTSISLL